MKEEKEKQDGVSDAPKETPVEILERFRIRRRKKDGTWEPWHPICKQKAEILSSVRRRQEAAQRAQEASKVTAVCARLKKLRDRLPHPARPAIRLPQGKHTKKIAGAVAAALAVAVIGCSVYVYQYPNVFPGVRVASVSRLGGLTQQEAAQQIERECEPYLRDSAIHVTAEGETLTLKAEDAVRAIDLEKSAETAYRVGREGGYFHRMGTVLGARLFGHKIPLSLQMNDIQMSSFLGRLSSAVETQPKQPSWTVDTEHSALVIDTGEAGSGFDHQAVQESLEQQLQRMDFSDLKVKNSVTQPEKPDAEEIARQANCPAKNATADPETGNAVDGTYGVEVSAKAIAKVIGDAGKQTYTVPVKLTEPEISKERLEDVLFRDVLAQSTTYFNDGQLGRTTNVRLTAESCDNTILNPGEEFSYNTIVGERTEERGYQVATIFVDGSSVEDYGGGACQSSSTIYMAVLRADLEVTERRNHQFRISYTPISQDATVAWGSQDFKFVNNTDYPIKIDMSMGDYSLTCTIYGTKTDDKTVELRAETSEDENYLYATLYKTVTVNGESTTTVENESAYRLNSDG